MYVCVFLLKCVLCWHVVTATRWILTEAILLVGNYCVCSTVYRLPHKCIGMMNAYCSPHVIVYFNY